MLCCFHGGKKSSVDFWGLGSFRFIALKCTFFSVGLVSFDCTEAGNLNIIWCLSREEVLKKCHHASLQLWGINTWASLLSSSDLVLGMCHFWGTYWCWPSCRPPPPLHPSPGHNTDTAKSPFFSWFWCLPARVSPPNLEPPLLLREFLVLSVNNSHQTSCLAAGRWLQIWPLCSVGAAHQRKERKKEGGKRGRKEERKKQGSSRVLYLPPSGAGNLAIELSQLQDALRSLSFWLIS